MLEIDKTQSLLEYEVLEVGLNCLTVRVIEQFSLDKALKQISKFFNVKYLQFETEDESLIFIGEWTMNDYSFETISKILDLDPDTYSYNATNNRLYISACTNVDSLTIRKLENYVNKTINIISAEDGVLVISW